MAARKETCRYVRIHRIRNIFRPFLCRFFFFFYLFLLLSRFSNISCFTSTTRVSFLYLANVATEINRVTYELFLYLSLSLFRNHTLLRKFSLYNPHIPIKRDSGKTLRATKLSDAMLQWARKTLPQFVNNKIYNCPYNNILPKVLILFYCTKKKIFCS